MPPDSADSFLIASIRAVRSFRRYLYSVFCQEPVRRLLRPYRLYGPLGSPGFLKPLGPLGPLGQLG
jgi:hypothetical protein